MNREITVRFLNDEWLPVTRDGSDYLLRYSFVDSDLLDKPEEESQTQDGYIIVGISGTLTSMWGLSRDDLRKVLFEYGKRHIGDMISEVSMGARTELQLTTANSPKKCPFDPKRIDIAFNTSLSFAGPLENPVASADPSSLAFQIVGLRDAINAIFGEKFEGRLLTLPQERHLVELFKSCTSREEFTHRVASLGGLATAIDAAPLKRLSPRSKTEEKEPTPKKRNSLDLLGAFLRRHYDENEANTVMDNLQGYNRLRRIYPIHTDRAGGVLAAHQFFNIDYPVSNYQMAWGDLLKEYRRTLELLLQLLKT
ncbi:MAG: hypothetical protein ISS66_16470 [Desulfobacteraceae bacterium]|nr:hypothetical protein [Desulfobacteraceae bacterium]